MRFLWAIFLSNFLLSFHFYLIVYINSSFLERFFTPSALSVLFMTGAAVNLALLLRGPALIKRFSDRRLTLFLIVLEFIAIAGLSFAKIPFLVALLFILHQAVVLMIFYNLDIFLEDYSPIDESRTGGIRGTYLTVSNLTLVASPTIAGVILSNGDWWKIYLFSALFLIPLYFVVKGGLREKLAEITSTSAFSALGKLRGNKDLQNILIIKLILQFFFAWMIIYMPIHLSKNLGFDWSAIGLIFTIMLLPYLFFTVPLGKLADKRIGEKEIMTAGFIVTALATALIPFINGASFLLWAGVLFLTRVGASFVDIGSESYFFKHVNAADADIISLYRITAPLSLVIAPVAAVLSFQLIDLWDLSYPFIFLILAIIILLGTRYTLTITDTK